MTYNAPPSNHSGSHPFRAAVFRGLAVVLPPLLTIVIFLWIGGTIQSYVLRPVSFGAQSILVLLIGDVRSESQLPAADRGQMTPTVNGVTYQRLPDKSYVPKVVYEAVRENPGNDEFPETGRGVYRRYMELRYLRPYLAIPLILAVFLLVLYLLGYFMAASIGRGLWSLVEATIARVPLVRNVYSAVKQVSDFVLSERELEYSRVVAIEYPRKGIWSLGLVTGDGLDDIEDAAGEPVLTVMIPTSPMLMAGFTVNILKSEALDLNITVDQAVQFIVSCGVVLPPRKLRELLPPLNTPVLNPDP